MPTGGILSNVQVLPSTSLRWIFSLSACKESPVQIIPILRTYLSNVYKGLLTLCTKVSTEKCHDFPNIPSCWLFSPTVVSKLWAANLEINRFEANVYILGWFLGNWSLKWMIKIMRD